MEAVNKYSYHGFIFTTSLKCKTRYRSSNSIPSVFSFSPSLSFPFFPPPSLSLCPLSFNLCLPPPLCLPLYLPPSFCLSVSPSLFSLLCKTGFYCLLLRQGFGDVKFFLCFFKWRLLDMFTQESTADIRDKERYITYRCFQIYWKQKGISQTLIYIASG